jgi:hypothetical protein
MSTENLQYLTVEQALADVAAFSRFLRSELSLPNLRFFTFGGSYPGALSVRAAPAEHHQHHDHHHRQLCLPEVLGPRRPTLNGAPWLMAGVIVAGVVPAGVPERDPGVAVVVGGGERHPLISRIRRASEWKITQSPCAL